MMFWNRKPRCMSSTKTLEKGVNDELTCLLTHVTVCCTKRAFFAHLHSITNTCSNVTFARLLRHATTNKLQLSNGKHWLLSLRCDALNNKPTAKCVRPTANREN